MALVHVLQLRMPAELQDLIFVAPPHLQHHTCASTFSTLPETSVLLEHPCGIFAGVGGVHGVLEMCVGWKHTSHRGKCWALFSEYRACQSRAVNMRLQLSQIRAVFEASWQPMAGENHRRDSPTHLSLLPLTMATSSEGNNQAKCVRSKWIAQHLLTITQYSQPLLTNDKCKEITNNARCLCRVANPFGDFYFIVAIGAAGSPTSTEVAQTCEDKQTQDHARNLYVFPTSAHHS